MIERVQLNTRIDSRLRAKVQKDSDRFGRNITRDVVVGAILHDFFNSWTVTERGKFYQRFLQKDSAPKNLMSPMTKTACPALPVSTTATTAAAGGLAQAQPEAVAV